MSSGAAPTLITSALLDRHGTCVDSVTAVSSGGGYFYSLHQLPNSAGPYANEWRAWINSYQYVDRQLVRVEDLQA